LYCSYCDDCTDCDDCYDKKGAKGKLVGIPVIENIDQAVYAAASQPGALATHCRAGWVVTLAGEAGKALEQRFNTELAAMLIYRESGSPINPCRFYDGDEDALEDMRKRALAEGEKQ
jgi:hypothetical protein